MNGIFKATFQLEGAADLVRRVRLMDKGVQTRTKVVIRRGTNEVVARGRVLVPRRSGELESTLRSEFSKDGMVGYAKAGYGKLLRRRSGTSRRPDHKARRRQQENAVQLALANTSRQALSVADLGVYALVVEYGDKRRNKPASRYMNRAFGGAKPGIVKGLQQAVQGAADQVVR